MYVYELFIETMAGSIVSSFDDSDEANALFAWAKKNKYEIVTRVVNGRGRVVSEKRYVTDKAGYEGGLLPSLEGLKQAVHHVQDEQDELEERLHRYAKELASA